MDLRGTSDMTVVITVQAEASLSDLLQANGIEDFKKQCRERLENQLEALAGIAAMKQIAEAASRPQGEQKT